MVGSMLLLKMLHCRSGRKKASKKTHGKRDKNNIYGPGSSQDGKIKVKKEASSNEICRICLKNGKLPIFSDDSTEELCESIYEIGAIEVCADDPYPKFLCQACHALLQGAILFKKTAQKSDNILKKQRETAKKSESVTEADEPGGYPSDNADEIPSEATEKKESPKKNVCQRCDLEFNTFQEYSDHLISAEHEDKRITCHICQNSYAYMYIKKHLRTHNQETTHICDVCGKKLTSKTLFTRHRLTHFYDLPIQCSLCPYRGRFSESLKMHMRSHTGEKPYQCEQCPSRFISKSNLNKHTLTHKGQHDFRCEVCGRGYYTKRELELHIKVDHTGIRDHVCGTCGKAFGYRKQLMKHELKVHKREKLRSGRMPIYLKVETMKQQNVKVAMET